MVQQTYQSLEVFFINRLRDWYSGFAEMTRFAEVQVGNDEGLLFFPENRSLTGKPEMLSFDLV